MDNRVIYIGMDLGTFKTSVASSTGERDVMYSAVGWPKDHVARSALGCDVVFGEDVIRQRLALEVVRPFSKGVLKHHHPADAGLSDAQLKRHKEAARLLIQNAVSRVRPPEDVPVCGVIVAPSRAGVANKRLLLEAASEAFDAVVIAPEPFTVAYGLGRLSNTLVVDIGAGTVDLCPMYGAYPTDEDQLTIPIGGDAVDEMFLRLVQESFPEARLSPNMARQIKEKYGFVVEAGEQVLVTLPVLGQPKQFDVTEPLREACTMIASPIVEGIRELVGQFDPEFQRSLLDNILLSGGGSQLKGLDRLIEDSLADYGGGNVTRVCDVAFAGAAGALKLAMNMPAEHWATIKALDDELPAADERRLCAAA